MSDTFQYGTRRKNKKKAKDGPINRGSFAV